MTRRAELASGGPFDEHRDEITYSAGGSAVDGADDVLVGQLGELLTYALDHAVECCLLRGPGAGRSGRDCLGHATAAMRAVLVD